MLQRIEKLQQRVLVESCSRLKLPLDQNQNQDQDQDLDLDLDLTDTQQPPSLFTHTTH